MALTLEQKIAQKEAEIARLKTAQRKLETGQKIIVGGAILKEAMNNDGFRNRIINFLEKNVDREVDKKRIQPLIDRLKKI